MLAVTLYTSNVNVVWSRTNVSHVNELVFSGNDFTLTCIFIQKECLEVVRVDSFLSCFINVLAV